MDGLRAEQKRTNDGYEARLKALTAERESDIPKKSIGATILGVGTMVLGAVTFQPAVVIAGAAVGATVELASAPDPTGAVGVALAAEAAVEGRPL